MRVLGIDPGTYKMGIGVVDSDAGNLTAAYYAVLEPPRRYPIANRLQNLYEGLRDTISEWLPSEVAVEEPFVARNVRSAIAIGQAEAVAMVAAAEKGLTISTYAPRQVKKAVTDYGGSSKEQVQDMVTVLLGLHETPDSFDATDALAVAICHVNSIEAENIIL